MYELVAPLRWIKLYDPVHVGNVDSTSRQISRQKHCASGISVSTKSQAPKFIINFCSLFLIDLSVELLYCMVRATSVFEEALEAFLVEID